MELNHSAVGCDSNISKQASIKGQSLKNETCVQRHSATRQIIGGCTTLVLSVLYLQYTALSEISHLTMFLGILSLQLLNAWDLG